MCVCTRFAIPAGLEMAAGNMLVLRSLGAILDPSWGYFGSKLGGLGAILAPSWEVLGPFWLQVGGVLGHFGSKLGVLGPSCHQVGFLGRSWLQVRGVLGLFWCQVGRS